MLPALLQAEPEILTYIGILYNWNHNNAIKAAQIKSIQLEETLMACVTNFMDSLPALDMPQYSLAFCEDFVCGSYKFILDYAYYWLLKQSPQTEILTIMALRVFGISIRVC